MATQTDSQRRARAAEFVAKLRTGRAEQQQAAATSRAQTALDAIKATRAARGDDAPRGRRRSRRRHGRPSGYTGMQFAAVPTDPERAARSAGVIVDTTARVIEENSVEQLRSGTLNGVSWDETESKKDLYRFARDQELEISSRASKEEIVAALIEASS